MHPARLVLIAFAIAVSGCATPPPVGNVNARDQVFLTEREFARTMADRDHEAFKTYLADEAIFFNGPEALRGKQRVADAWARFYTGDEPPFSWEPDTVEVLDSGSLALSSGPVRDPKGNVVGRFNSVWRRESAGTWRVVFDRGSEVCSDEAR